jgi:hypothetical protein
VPRRSQNREEFRSRLAGIAGWQTATRDDRQVAQELHRTRAVDRVHALDEVAFFDELFHYFREIDFWPILEGLDPGQREGEIYPFLKLILITIMRCVGGVQSMLATHDLLLTDEGLMGLLGFNAAQVQKGSTARGLSQRSGPVEIRGALSYETVADAIVQIGPERLATMFNGAIRCLARQRVFAKQLDVVLDATDNEATPTYKTDDGRRVPHVVREKRPDVRANRHARKVEVRVFGWKVWIVWEPQFRLPLALAIDGINESDNKHALAVLQTAQKNVEGYATIRSVALDRGFLDGKLLTAIEGTGIRTIYIPAKRSMEIAKDARALARQAVKEVETHGRNLDNCRFRERHDVVKRGAGKHAKNVTLTTTLVGIRDLACDWWNVDGSYAPKVNSKEFESRLVNAVVVMRWDGAPKDAEKEVVFLTTGPVDDPFVAFDAYDRRSLIENTCNREAKEHWFLEHHPKRSEAGVRVHTYFVFTCMALVEAYRGYKAKADLAARRGKESGVHRYRRRLIVENRDKVAVFIGDHFGIFRTYELCLMMGVGVREREGLGETQETILRRYGIQSSDSGSS